MDEVNNNAVLLAKIYTSCSEMLSAPMVELLCSPLLLNTNYVVEKWILLYTGNN